MVAHAITTSSPLVMWWTLILATVTYGCIIIASVGVEKHRYKDNRRNSISPTPKYVYVFSALAAVGVIGLLVTLLLKVICRW